MEEIKRLLWEGKYSECLEACKKKLNVEPNNAKAWYYMFLADNANFTKPLEYMNDEIAYEKALELSIDEEKEYFEYSHVVLDELKGEALFPNLYLAIAFGETEEILAGFRRILMDKSVSNGKLSSSFAGIAMDLMTRENDQKNLYQMYFYLVSLHFADMKFRRIYDAFAKGSVSLDTVSECLGDYKKKSKVQEILKEAEEEKVPEEIKLPDLKPGDVFEFGKYCGERISWRVLDVMDGCALMLTDKIIEARRFDSAKNNYEGSEIRKWLNEEFLNSFTKEEKARIQITEVDNSLRSTMCKSNSHICRNTMDQVFLLSREEATKYFRNNTQRQCSGTSHARLDGLWVYNGFGCWWLRSSNPDWANNERAVGDTGEIRNALVIYGNYGVRPACRIKL